MAEQWATMSQSLQAQARKFEAEADKLDNSTSDSASALRTTVEQWKQAAQSAKTQAKQFADKAREARTATKPLYDQGGVSVVEQDGRTVIKKDGKVMVDVSSEGRSRTASANRSHGTSDTGFIVFIVFLFLFLTVNTIVKAVTGRGRYRRAETATPTTAAGFSPEELALVGRMQKTLTQMEGRVEALETILIEQTNRPKTASVARTSL